MERLKIPDDVPIEAKMVRKAIERAQTQVESRTSRSARTSSSTTRSWTSSARSSMESAASILEGEDFRDTALELVTDVVEGIVDANTNPDVLSDDWDWDQIFSAVREIWPTTMTPERFRHEQRRPGRGP